ncbi:MAG: hypothetical protein E6K68_02605, partial [Nitrospirae bacterium]
LMIGFGAAFGYTVMSRMSLLIGRFSDLITYAGAKYGYASLVLLALAALGLAARELLSRRASSEGPPS